MKRALVLLAVMALSASADELDLHFATPPNGARPWVYWFPLNGNLSKDGITADLEAMARVGIGGVLYMEVDQGAPRGPADFAGPLWRELLTHAGREAQRLGLEINMNNDAGWCGSGGPWITPELSMQKVVWTETIVNGPQQFSNTLAQPRAEHGYYRDIAVLAMPLPAGNVRTAQIDGKASFKPQQLPPQPAKFASVSPNAAIARDKIAEITSQMDAAGKLTWSAPGGKWLVMRFGHTTTGKDNHPAPESGRGLECDKFNKQAVEAHYRGLMSKLVDDYGKMVGKTLVTTHIDSWEVGSQNWTPRMREEFRERRGYDLLPFLPAYAGYIVDSSEVTERFLWDLRQIVSDLIIENYAGEFRRLAHQDGLRLSIEAYDGVPCDEMKYAGQADEPMAEFWKVGPSTEYSCTEMASAAHTYGKPILGAEAFTSTDVERWLEHPGSIKGLGDWAFCEGINRFVFHRYAAQPWTHVAPGMSMGPWGLHYERTQTWWEQSKAWHEYLARCQYLLQQGLFVADVLYLQPEGAPRRFVAPTKIRDGYNFDGCTTEVLLTRATVQDGRIVLPDGMSYRVLALPQTETMTPALVRKVKQLVDEGAVVFAAGPPQKAPGLTDFPQCDEVVNQLVREIWNSGKIHKFVDHEGRVATSISKSAKWIWSQNDALTASSPGKRHFRRLVMVDANNPVRSAHLVISADNSFECRVNGRRTGAGSDFHRASIMDVTSAFKPGGNTIEVAATNDGSAANPAGVIGTLTIKLQNGKTIQISTDRNWEARVKRDEWVAASELGPLGIEPWGDVEVAPHGSELYPQAAAVREWLAGQGVPPDFKSTPRLNYIHKAIGDVDVYFVANPEPREITAVAEFRVVGRVPEFWWPESGAISHAQAFSEKSRTTDVPVHLEPNGSVFVVFRAKSAGANPVVSVQRDTHELLTPTKTPTILIRNAQYGLLEDPKRTRDVTNKLQALVDVGESSVRVATLAEGDDPAYGTVKTLDLNYEIDGLPQHAIGRDSDTIRLEVPDIGTIAPLDISRGEIRESGAYSLRTLAGKTRTISVTLPAEQSIVGPWQVAFDSHSGGSENATFETLQDWSLRPEKEIKHFSGAATYRKEFELRRPDANSKSELDLGRVEVIADVTLNGKDLGTLWKRPYRVDVTNAIVEGTNQLEIRVANLWVNRQIGDELLPEDSERNANGTLKSWPAWLLEGKASPTGRRSFTSWRLWKKDAALVPSGLIGPVTVRAIATLPAE